LNVSTRRRLSSGEDLAKIWRCGMRSMRS
jgi:hypothetical protein